MSAAIKRFFIALAVSTVVATIGLTYIVLIYFVGFWLLASLPEPYNVLAAVLAAMTLLVLPWELLCKGDGT